MRYTDPGGGIRQKTGKLASSRRPSAVARGTQSGGAMLRLLPGWPASRRMAAALQPHHLALPARIYGVAVMPSAHGPDNMRDT